MDRHAEVKSLVSEGDASQDYQMVVESDTEDEERLDEQHVGTCNCTNKFVGEICNEDDKCNDRHAANMVKN